MNRERIEDMREVVLPFVTKRLMETNYENLGESDAKEFAKDFDEILNLVIKALEQEPNCSEIPTGSTTKNDLALIHTGGLNEGIRCAMCTNSMANDRGCDGACVVNTGMYKKVMDVIEDHIADTDKKMDSTTKNDLGVDCISREATVKRLCNLAEYMNEHKKNSGDPYIMAALFIQDNKTEFPSVTPQEPFINKPCVSSGVCEHDKQKVLDKIRSEIEQYQSDYDIHGTEYDRTAWKAFNRCLQIINKYKSEIEPQESEDV